MLGDLVFRWMGGEGKCMRGRGVWGEVGGRLSELPRLVIEHSRLVTCLFSELMSVSHMKRLGKA